MARKIKSELPPRPLHFLKEWREKKNLTQEQLGDLVETTKGQISLLESSAYGDDDKQKRGLSPKWARRLGKALRIQPGWLLDYHPDEFPADFIEIWGGIPEDRKGQALKVLETFAKKRA